MPRRKRRRNKVQNQQPVVPRKPKPKRNQFVIRHQKGWAVKKEGSTRITAFFEMQEDAIAYGRELAITQHCELVIHNRKGEVRIRRDYRDPRHDRANRHARYLAAVAALQREREEAARQREREEAARLLETAQSQ
jgi:Uncharacterized protein conserved in bacteria (DUF2188)